MRKTDIVELVLANKVHSIHASTATAFAPSNIALVKYWGKRDAILNLALTDSLSISLADKGATTNLEIIDAAQDEFWLNGEIQANDNTFSQRLIEFLNLFRSNAEHYRIKTETNIPVAAGLASSACGFAALTKALDKLYNWQLNPSELSILARLGSGSACRSIYSGFVWWQKGMREDGMDSFAIPLETRWPELCIGLLLLSTETKAISSRAAMQRTVASSHLYEAWPLQVAQDLQSVNEAILAKNFTRFGEVSEHNALSMHATMLSAWPPILYANAETIDSIKQIWELRKQGLELYFTQDAGPNLKLLFLEKDTAEIKRNFPKLEIIKAFS